MSTRTDKRKSIDSPKRRLSVGFSLGKDRQKENTPPAVFMEVNDDEAEKRERRKSRSFQELLDTPNVNAGTPKQKTPLFSNMQDRIEYSDEDEEDNDFNNLESTPKKNKNNNKNKNKNSNKNNNNNNDQIDQEEAAEDEEEEEPEFKKPTMKGGLLSLTRKISAGMANNNNPNNTNNNNNNLTSQMDKRVMNGKKVQLARLTHSELTDLYSSVIKLSSENVSTRRNYLPDIAIII